MGRYTIDAMMRAFRTLIERQILKAKAEGKLEGLQGQGNPLPDHPEAPFVDSGTAVGMRIMAEAGVKPEEFVLKSQLDAARKTYTTLTDDAQRKSAMARIADLEMRYNIARDARRKFMS